MIVALCLLALGQIVNPADKHPEETRTRTSTEGGVVYPPVVVHARAEGAYREEDPVGPAEQPEWTAHRRFGETRIYVIPEGQYEFEYWLITESPRSGDTTLAIQYEAEIGLPYRFQLDMYGVQHKDLGTSGSLSLDQAMLEVRWALADWGKLPLNPTLYLEYKALSNAADHVEAKLLLADRLFPGFHYGLNVVLEHELGGEYGNSYEFTGGVSYAAIDGTLALGAEWQIALEDRAGHRFDFTHEDFLLGPSVQVRMLKRMHIDIAPLFGLTAGSIAAKVFAIAGWAI